MLFGLLHLNTSDLRRTELVGRRAMLRKLLRKAGPALIYSEHMEAGEALRRSLK